LAVELWDELSSNPDEIPVTEEQLDELDRRFEEYRHGPDKIVTWEEAKARILSVGVNGGGPSSLCRTGSSRGVQLGSVVDLLVPRRTTPPSFAGLADQVFKGEAIYKRAIGK
jgi:putative addiction module component (TIGR02574 family)